MIERQLGGSVLTPGAWGSRSREPDLLRAEAFARHGCIIRGLVGLTARGLSNSGTDDRDELGVCVEPARVRGRVSFI